MLHEFVEPFFCMMEFPFLLIIYQGNRAHLLILLLLFRRCRC
jgi:hypothetical protein